MKLPTIPDLAELAKEVRDGYDEMLGRLDALNDSLQEITALLRELVTLSK